MSSISIPVETFITTVAIFIRIGSIMFALPLFGDQPISPRIRVILSVSLTATIIPTLQNSNLILNDSLEILVVVIQEIILGLIIGFVGRLAFVGTLMAASVVAYQMGFGTANLLMPGVDHSIDPFSAFHRILILLIFLSLNLHHTFLSAIFKSLEIIPLGRIHIGPNVVAFLVSLSSNIFRIAVQLAAPLLISLLFTMTALGLASRAVPQMNVFTMSFPISFFIGMLIYIATMDLIPTWISDHFSNFNHDISLLINALKP